MGRAGGGDVWVMLFCCPLLLTDFPAIPFLSVCNSMCPPWVDPVTFALHRVEDFKGKRVDKGALKQLLWKESVASRWGQLYYISTGKGRQEARGALQNHATEGLFGKVGKDSYGRTSCEDQQRKVYSSKVETQEAQRKINLWHCWWASWREGWSLSFWDKTMSSLEVMGVFVFCGVVLGLWLKHPHSTGLPAGCAGTSWGIAQLPWGIWNNNLFPCVLEATEHLPLCILHPLASWDALNTPT